MIRTAIICFTPTGLALAKRIKDANVPGEYSFEIYAKYEGAIKDNEVNLVAEGLYDWTYAMQTQRIALIFVGAMGIAVRAIAKGLENKLSDAPVVVVDEMGYHVIPVIGGHVGGANELALHVAAILGSDPVITTATDLEGSFSVDLFAKENGLVISDKSRIAKVSAKALAGKAVKLSIENFPPTDVDVIVSRDMRLSDSGDLILCPKEYAVGIGCRKGTSFETLKDFLLEQLNDIDISNVGAIGSINLKEDEDGLLELCRYFRIPFITFTPELLAKAVGEFEESDFVREKTGIGNVCERAAILLTGNKGSIVTKKCARNGMTIAIARMGDR